MWLDISSKIALFMCLGGWSSAQASIVGIFNTTVYASLTSSPNTRFLHKPVWSNSAEVRLVGGDTPFDGRPELLANKWTPVCDSYLHPNVATVLCRMLGLPTNNVTIKSNKYIGNWDKWLTCDGDEKTILDECQWIIWPETDCPMGEENGISCNGNIRLTDGTYSQNGNIELFRNGAFTSICDLDPDFKVARVICRQMGFDIERSALTTNSYFGLGHTGTHRVTCTGNEMSVEHCKFHRLPENSSCPSNHVLGVDCNATQYEIEVMRMSPGGMSININTYGISGYWSENLPAADGVAMEKMKKIASVICHELGYSRYDPELSEVPLLEKIAYPIQFSEVFTCSGLEDRLSECSIAGDPDGVLDSTNNLTEIAINCKDVLSLHGGETRHSGILMQRNDSDGTLRPFADIRPDYPTALVACRQLGYNSSAVEIQLKLIVDEVERALLVEFLCSGKEQLLRDCQVTHSHNRRSNAVVWLNCKAANIALSEIYFSMGNGSRSEKRFFGRREGEQGVSSWMRFCHSGTTFDVNTAGVICHQLGYSRSEAKFTLVSALEQTAVLDDLDRYACVGWEEAIDQCPKDGKLRRQKCQYDVNVICKDVSQCMNTDMKMPSKIINCLDFFCSGNDCYKDNNGISTIIPCSLENGEACKISKTYRISPFGNTLQTVYSHCEPACKSRFSKDKYFYRLDECCFSDMCNSNNTVVLENNYFRFVDGVLPWEGYVQFYSKSSDTWFYIHDHTSITDKIIEAICAGCGYFATIGSKSPIKGRKEETIDDTCFLPGSDPAYFGDCNIKDLTSGCFLTKTACSVEARLRISCNAIAPKTRLVDGGETSKGRVEIFFLDRWGTVCTRGIHKGVSDVLCRSLGFASGCSQNTTSGSHRARFPRGYGSIHFENVSCHGNEDSILKCNFSYVDEDSECSHEDDLGIICVDVSSHQVEGNLIDVEGNPIDVEVNPTDMEGTVIDVEGNGIDEEENVIDVEDEHKYSTTSLATAPSAVPPVVVIASETGDSKIISCFEGQCDTTDCSNLSVSRRRSSRCKTTPPAFCYVEKQEITRSNVVKYTFGCSQGCLTGVFRNTIGQIKTKYCCATELCNVNGNDVINNITAVVDENTADNFTDPLVTAMSNINVTNVSVEDISSSSQAYTTGLWLFVILTAHIAGLAQNGCNCNFENFTGRQ